MTRATVPLFPLNTVLFPEGPLPLRVFEPRYLSMVSRCLKEDSGFGVVLIMEGAEAGGDTTATAAVGTLARITDWYQGSDGILGITAHGTRRFRLHEATRQADGLYLGEVDVEEPPAPVPLPPEFAPLADLLKAVITDLGRLYEGIEPRYGDAHWVGCRLAEILPIPLTDRQQCLEEDDALRRLGHLKPLLRTLRGDRPQ